MSCTKEIKQKRVENYVNLLLKKKGYVFQKVSKLTHEVTVTQKKNSVCV